jgi:tetratricopeptide (TPR) repeat protein
MNTWAAKAELLSAARPLALKALALAPDLSQAHVALGDISWVEMDWPAAEREYKRAFELNPALLDLCGCYANLLASLGRLQEAETIIQHAATTNPLSSDIEGMYGAVKYFQRQLPPAISHYQRAIELNPKNPLLYGLLAGAYWEMGKSQESLAVLARPELRESGAVARIYALKGQRTEALKILHALLAPGRPTFADYGRIGIAIVYFALGDKENGFQSLTKAVDEKDIGVRFLKVDPLWDNIRSDTRYQRLVARLNFPPGP